MTSTKTDGSCSPIPSALRLTPILTDASRHQVSRAGASGVRLHDLRNFHASVLLLRANTHPKVVIERLGHPTIAVTSTSIATPYLRYKLRRRRTLPG